MLPAMTLVAGEPEICGAVLPLPLGGVMPLTELFGPPLTPTEPQATRVKARKMPSTPMRTRRRVSELN